MPNEFLSEKYFSLVGQLEYISENIAKLYLKLIRMSLSENYGECSELKAEIARLYVSRRHTFKDLEQEAVRLGIDYERYLSLNQTVGENHVSSHVNCLPFMYDDLVNMDRILKEKLTKFGIFFKNSFNQELINLNEVFSNQYGCGYFQYSMLAGLSIAKDAKSYAMFEDQESDINLTSLEVLKLFLINCIKISSLFTVNQVNKIIKILALLDDMIISKKLLDMELNKARGDSSEESLVAFMKQGQLILERNLS